MNTLKVVKSYVKEFIKEIAVKVEDVDVVSRLIIRMITKDNLTICSECQHAVMDESGEKYYLHWYGKGYTVKYTEKLDDIFWICKAYEKVIVNLLTGEENIENVFCININGKSKTGYNGNCPRFKARELSEFMSEEDVKKVNDYVEEALVKMNDIGKKEIEEGSDSLAK